MFGTVHTVENPQVVYVTKIIAVENNGDVVSTVVIPGDVEVYYASTIDYSYTAYCGKNLTGIFYGDTVTFAVLPFMIVKYRREQKADDDESDIDEELF
jgi:hypothetical protein